MPPQLCAWSCALQTSVKVRPRRFFISIKAEPATIALLVITPIYRDAIRLWQACYGLSGQNSPPTVGVYKSAHLNGAKAIIKAGMICKVGFGEGIVSDRSGAILPNADVIR